MLKNRRTVTAHSDTNAVFTFAEIWRMVNMANPLKYTPRRRWTNRMKNPDADQNRLSVPMSINAVAMRKYSPKYTRPSRLSSAYAFAKIRHESTNTMRQTMGLRTGMRSLRELADSSVASLQREICTALNRATTAKMSAKHPRVSSAERALNSRW